MVINETDFIANFGSLTLQEQQIIRNFFQKKVNTDRAAKLVQVEQDLALIDPNYMYDLYVAIEAPESFVLADFLTWAGNNYADQLTMPDSSSSGEEV